MRKKENNRSSRGGSRSSGSSERGTGRGKRDEGGKSFGKGRGDRSFSGDDDKGEKRSYGSGRSEGKGFSKEKRSFGKDDSRDERSSERKSFSKDDERPSGRGFSKERRSSGDDGDKRERRSSGERGERKSFSEERRSSGASSERPGRKWSSDDNERSYDSDSKRAKRSFGGDDDRKEKRSYGEGRSEGKSSSREKRSFGDDDRKEKRSYGEGRSEGKSSSREKRSFGDDDRKEKRSYGEGRSEGKSSSREKRSFGDDDRKEKRSYGEGRSEGKSFSREKRSFGDDDRKEKRSFSRDDDRKSSGFGAKSRSRRDDDDSGSDGEEGSDKRKTYKITSKNAPKKKTKDEELGLVRLNRYIANAGICSRREADTLIGTGVVSVNGKIITEMGYKVKPGDIIKYNGETLSRERMAYILLNKPKDYITTLDDPEGRKTVLELIQGAGKERVYPVGRLDRATTGVLLLTNDGDLTKRLTHPRYGVKKTYHVTLDKSVKPSDIEKIMTGIELEDGSIKADDVAYVGDGKDRAQVGIELHSGKNRIVRRIFEHLGYKVEKLDRVTFAGLTKKDLPRGRWRHLTEREVGMLYMISSKDK